MSTRRGRNALPTTIEYLDRVDEARKAELDVFLERVGVKFKDYNLLNRALSHKSYTNEHNYNHNEQSEKLEFFGDGVLGLIMNEYLFKVFPDSEEGDLAKIKSVVVSETNLAEIALEIDLSPMILVGRSEMRNGQNMRPSLLADILEAFIGALYIDQGIAAVRRFILQNFESSIRSYSSEESVGDFKSFLQEQVQKKYGERPIYRVQRASGPDHSRTFRITVSFRGRVWATGAGKSKKEAEQDAAEKAYKSWQESKDQQPRRRGGRDRDGGRRRDSGRDEATLSGESIEDGENEAGGENAPEHEARDEQPRERHRDRDRGRSRGGRGRARQGDGRRRFSGREDDDSIRPAAPIDDPVAWAAAEDFVRRPARVAADRPPEDQPASRPRSRRRRRRR